MAAWSAWMLLLCPGKARKEKARKGKAMDITNYNWLHEGGRYLAFAPALRCREESRRSMAQRMDNEGASQQARYHSVGSWGSLSVSEDRISALMPLPVTPPEAGHLAPRHLVPFIVYRDMEAYDGWYGRNGKFLVYPNLFSPERIQ